MIIAGIDEAGRGPCIGPLVIGIVSIDKDDEEQLIELGVKDSKLLEKEVREELYPQVKKIAKEHYTIQIPADEIDKLMNRHSLNEIEAMKAALLVNQLKLRPDIILADSPDTTESNYAERIKRYLSFKANIRSEHKADFNYVVVGAASILAKVERDNEIEEMHKKYGDFGTGYPHDERTIAFIKEFLDKNGKLPDIVRKKWSTTNDILDNKYQTKLF
jgi:ribonuclease HII